MLNVNWSLMCFSSLHLTSKNAYSHCVGRKSMNILANRWDYWHYSVHTLNWTCRLKFVFVFLYSISFCLSFNISPFLGWKSRIRWLCWKCFLFSCLLRSVNIESVLLSVYRMSHRLKMAWHIKQTQIFKLWLLYTKFQIVYNTAIGNRHTEYWMCVRCNTIVALFKCH